MSSIIHSVNPIVDNIYQQIKDIFNKKDLTTTKSTIIEILLNYCETATNEEVFELKTRLETDLAIDVNCAYCILGTTPKNIGCDLREIIFDIHGNATQKGEQLLDLFERKKIPNKIWHILTDIDDTLYPHHGHTILDDGIAGKDKTWINKAPYPGIISFYNLFYETINNTSAKYSTLLSATPGCLKSRRLTYKPIGKILGSRYGFIQGTDNKRELIRDPTAVSTFNTYGKLKFERFTQYFRIFPDYNFVFIGDNGQGDVVAGRLMLDYVDEYNIRNQNDKRNCYVLIHKISEDGKTYKKSSESHANLFYFENYYEAAKQLHELSIIDSKIPNLIKEAISNKVKSSEYKSFYQSLFDLPISKNSSSTNTAHSATTKHAKHGGKNRHIRYTKKRKNRYHGVNMK